MSSPSSRPSSGVPAVAALVLLLGGASCAGVRMDVPDGFLQLETESRQIKATTPDAALLWVRRFADEDRGDADFWAAALLNDLRGRRGYELVDRSTVRDAAGRAGHAMEFRADVEGRRQGYLVAVFVRPGGGENTVCTVELVAPVDEFERLVGSVRAALATLRH